MNENNPTFIKIHQSRIRLSQIDSYEVGVQLTVYLKGGREETFAYDTYEALSADVKRIDEVIGLT